MRTKRKPLEIKWLGDKPFVRVTTSERTGHYITGMLPPNHPVPAHTSFLDMIAAQPMEPWEDFRAIAWWHEQEMYALAMRELIELS